MARTIRRKKYVPLWVTEEWGFEYTTDPVTGLRRFLASFQLTGKERAAQLRWWHEDKARPWGISPPTYHRKRHEEQHRARARCELTRWVKDPDYPVQIERKPTLDYWD
jgi:hypothetical protein